VVCGSINCDLVFHPVYAYYPLPLQDFFLFVIQYFADFADAIGVIRAYEYAIWGILVLA